VTTPARDPPEDQSDATTKTPPPLLPSDEEEPENDEVGPPPPPPYHSSDDDDVDDDDDGPPPMPRGSVTIDGHRYVIDSGSSARGSEVAAAPPHVIGPLNAIPEAVPDPRVRASQEVETAIAAAEIARLTAERQAEQRVAAVAAAEREASLREEREAEIAQIVSCRRATLDADETAVVPSPY
jgi:hypothetical protein